MRATEHASNPQPQRPAAADAYTDFVKREARFEHLRTGSATKIAESLFAHPIHAIKDPEFTDAILSTVKSLVGDGVASAEQLFDARRTAIHRYVIEHISGHDSSKIGTFSGKALALVARCFPKEPEAVTSWGCTYFNGMNGAALIPTKDANGALIPSYEILNSYVYAEAGEPRAIGGFYAEKQATGEYSMWGARIAIDPAIQGSAMFGKLLAHLATVAHSTIEASRQSLLEGKTPLAPSLSVFTTRADWNKRVISIYKGLGFHDLGPAHDMTYNGLTEMVMYLPDLTSPAVQDRMSAFVQRFGPVGRK